MQPPSQRTGGRMVVDALRLHGADRLFCMPGESFLAVLDALHDAPEIQVVLCRHEGAGANMAEADGKLTGRPGICLVTRGPGATHASVGVHTAAQDSTPMILLVGQVPRPFLGREAFQEVDYVRMFGGMAKWAAQIESADEIPAAIARAFHTAMSGRPGPVVLALPEDLQRDLSGAPEVAPSAVDQPNASLDQLNLIRRHLGQARQPLVIAGGSGWTMSACDDLARFAAAHSLPVATAFRRQHLIDNADPHFVGYLSPTTSLKLAAYVKSADLILAIGTRLGEFTTGGYSFLNVAMAARDAHGPRATTSTEGRTVLVHVHPSAEELGKLYLPALAIQAGMPPFCAQLAALPAIVDPPWRALLSRVRAEYETFSSAPDLSAGSRFRTTQLLREMERLMPANAIVTNGAGNYSIWLHRFHRYRRFNSQVAPTSGAMGYALPAAVAAALRHRDRPVVCFTGDGDFMMYPQELAAIAEHRLWVIVIVVNNGRLGTIRMHQEKAYPGRAIATDLVNPDFSALAGSFGISASAVSTSAAFAAALEAALGNRVASLIDARVDPDDLTPERRLGS